MLDIKPFIRALTDDIMMKYTSAHVKSALRKNNE